MKSRLRAAAIAAALAALPATAAITELKVTSTQPYGEFARGKYVRIEAEAHGALDPAAEAIPGLAQAPRNAQGRVEYRVPVTLLVPEKRAGNGALLVDVPNRGRPISHGLYNSPRVRSIAVGSLDQGTGFLEERGFTVAVVQWELGEGPQLPAFEGGGRKLYAEGVGFAALRDVAIFLRDAGKAGNPVAGTIDRTLAVGYSQTARLLKSFLVNGFNEQGGKTAFDGLHLMQAAGGVMPLLDAGPGPGSVAAVTPGHRNPEHRGVHEAPFTWGEVMASAAGKYRKAPRVIVSNAYNDYLGGRASLVRTGASSADDQPIPGNVRIYDISGSPHINGRARNPDCGEGPGQLDWAPAARAQLVALDAWVAKGGKAPPASRLFTLEARPTDPEVFQAPAYLPGAVVKVPVKDRDGNAQSGLVLPDVAVPVATHGAMNTPLATMACRQAGTYRPFALKADERKAKNDDRLSLEERYPGGINEYVTKVRMAANALVAERLLLPEDATVIVHAAAENPAFTPTRPRARGATPQPGVR